MLSAEFSLNKIRQILSGQDGEAGIVPAKMLFLGGEAITPAGSSADATIPAGATSAILTAEGGSAYYALNDSPADSSAGGFVGENMNAVVPGISNWISMAVYAEAGVTVHINYFKE